MTWIEVAVRNAGLRKAIAALTWAYSWATVREALGYNPTVDEVADWWKQSRRTAFRDQSAFREAFPTLATPARIYERPESRAKLAKAAEASDNLRQALHSRGTIREAAILDVGMTAASI